MSSSAVVVPKASFFRSTAGGVPSGATEGSSMGPGLEPFFFTFSGHLLDPFLEHFFMIFWAQNGVQNLVKTGPKTGSFLSSRWGPFFQVFELPRVALWHSSGPLGAVLGVSRAK